MKLCKGFPRIWCDLGLWYALREEHLWCISQFVETKPKLISCLPHFQIKINTQICIRIIKEGFAKKNVFFSFQQKFGPKLHKWVFLQGGKICADTSLLSITQPSVITVFVWQIQSQSLSCNELRLLVLASRHQLLIAEQAYEKLKK